MTVSAELAGAQVQREKSHELTALLAMEGGEGERSYAKNSRTQADGLKFVHAYLEAAINEISLPKRKVVNIADLGCSSGPNSVEHMNLVVSMIKSRFSASSQIDFMPEFQVFFVDLLSNDFNSLFRLITQSRKVEGSRRSLSTNGAADYMWAGVPGSFYGRLLPRAHLDVVFSSFSLHWLSKIPEEVQQADSPAYNDGFVWIHGGKPLVAKAYAEQAKRDMCEFLRARAEEMVSGGLMFLLLKGRKDSNPTTQYDPNNGTTMFGRYMEELFDDLVREGLLDREVRDSFNIPIYYRTVEEMREAVNEVSEFVTVRVDLLEDAPGNPVTQEELRASTLECGRRVAKICRSLLGVLVESHMGVAVADEFFSRLERRAIERSEEEARQERVSLSHVNLVVLLRK